jgi:hypothetical protein
VSISHLLSEIIERDQEKQQAAGWNGIASSGATCLVSLGAMPSGLRPVDTYSREPRFFTQLIRFRRVPPMLQREGYDLDAEERSLQLAWHSVELGKPNWSLESRSLAIHLHTTDARGLNASETFKAEGKEASRSCGASLGEWSTNYVRLYAYRANWRQHGDLDSPSLLWHRALRHPSAASQTTR